MGSYYSEDWLAELVQEFVGQLEASPGTFDLDMENFTATLNECITTEGTLQELVGLIYTQVRPRQEVPSLGGATDLPALTAKLSLDRPRLSQTLPTLGHDSATTCLTICSSVL